MRMKSDVETSKNDFLFQENLEKDTRVVLKVSFPILFLEIRKW